MTLKSQTERCEIRQIFRSSLILKQLRRGDFFGASERDLIPVKGLNFQYNKTGFIPTSDSPKNSPLYCSPCVSCCVVRTRLKPPPPPQKPETCNQSLPNQRKPENTTFLHPPFSRFNYFHTLSYGFPCLIFRTSKSKQFNLIYQFCLRFRIVSD